MSLTTDRAERGRYIMKDYHGHDEGDLAVILTDLCAYADILGPAAFANAVNTALVRNDHSGASFS